MSTPRLILAEQLSSSAVTSRFQVGDLADRVLPNRRRSKGPSSSALILAKSREREHESERARVLRLTTPRVLSAAEESENEQALRELGIL